MAKYHINPSSGEPGVCKASLSCPFGDFQRDHYDSPEQARAAYEASMEDEALPRHDVHVNEQMLVSLDPVTVAETSTDPAALYAAAEVATEDVARALRYNMAADASVLVTARSKGTDLNFVMLETHPAYPVNYMSGALLKGWPNLPGGVVDKFKSNDVSDKVVKILIDPSTPAAAVGHYNMEPALTAFANPKNRLSRRFVREVAVNHAEFAMAAIQSGRFPTREDIEGETEVTYFNERETVAYTNPDHIARYGPSFERARRGPVSDNILKLAAQNSPNYGTVYGIAKKFKDTEQEDRIVDAINRNYALHPRDVEAIGKALDLPLGTAAEQAKEEVSTPPASTDEYTVIQKRSDLFARFRNS